MPSQEDNLDELLKELAQEDDDIFGGNGAELDLRDPLEMSEEEISNFLAEREAEAQSVAEETVEDVLDLKGGSGDSDLTEIQELLKKSDRNEAVDTSGSSQREENPAEKLMADIEKAGAAEALETATDSKEKKAQEKKRLKAEKKAAKEAAKAEKKAKRKGKKGEEKGATQSLGRETLPEKATEGVQEYDILQDKAILDNIVAEAGKAEHTEWDEASQDVDLMEVAAALEAERDVDISQEVPYMEENASSGTDLDTGVLALGLDEIDNYIPDITESAQEKEPKKKGVFSKLVDFLMEEEEESENENVQISDENQEIIREMDSEEAEKAKKKTEKKTKKKEAAKKKEKKKKEPKPKKEKPPKPKKEKKPKEEDPYPVRKLSFKKVLPIVLLGASVGAALFIIILISVDYSNQQTARAAFDSGDYKTCYTYLHGKKLNEAEEQMYHKSECILHIGMWYREYEMLESDGSELQALDSLIQSVHEFPKLYEYALGWDAGTEVSVLYTGILGILSEKYGITEEQAREIANLPSDIAYTRAVMAVAEAAGYWERPGGSAEDGQKDTEGFEGVDLQGGEEEDAGPQPDELPEEEEIDPEDFVEND